MDKTILSFDVGIKNLAYCIIEFKNEDFTIKDWNIINLVDDRIKCCYEKNNKKCESIAKHVFNIKELDNNEIDNKELYYCKTHLKKAEYKIVIPFEKIKCTKCKNYSEYIIENTNFGWCEKHSKVEIEKFKRRCVKNLSQSCTKQSLTKLGVSLCEKLDSIEEIYNVDEILIENQPALKNPTMKTISSMLFYHFIIRGMKEKIGKFKDNINFVSPSGKLKVNNIKSNEEIKKGKTEKQEYDIRKELGIKYTKAIISTNDLQYLNKFKKQDDLCDAFLQAIRIYYKENIPKNIIEKLNLVIK